MFVSAVPVYAKSMQDQMNTHLFLKETIDSLVGTKLYITAFSFFRLWINGSFVFFGPSRGPGGYARVEVLDLTAYNCPDGNNEILIEVAGYRCGSLATVNRSSFVVAELRRKEEVLLYTGRDFAGFCPGLRVQKCERYSVQRHFGEIWDYTVGNPFTDAFRVNLVPVTDVPKYIKSTPHPLFSYASADQICSVGTFSQNEALPVRKNRYSWQEIPQSWGVFQEDEIESFPHRWIQKQQMERSAGETPFSKELKAGQYALVDMKKIYTGFLQMQLHAITDAQLVVGFSELCEGETFSFTSMNAQNVIEYHFAEGQHKTVMSFEPYTCRYIVIMVKSGLIRLDSAGVYRYEYDSARIKPRLIQDPALRRIYNTAVRTFSHNVVDIFMDCPSRERAGWLCDSYFMGKVEHFLTGETAVEDAFLENYRLHTGKGNLPKGVLPECYPSDFEGNFIPQWNLWYILQVYEYLTQRNLNADKELFRKSVYGILAYMKTKENENGLLEKLPSWNFVEWSKANQWVQDINYPTNFLYAQALDCTAQLYGDENLAHQADSLRKTVIEKAFNGEIFIDNAKIVGTGQIQNTENFSEAGQYYGILFGNIDLEDPQYHKLKDHVENSFCSFDPDAENFVPVNMFIGYFLRLMVLMKLDRRDLLAQDVKRKFLPMIDLTDTLWEYNFHQRRGSYDHGFSSFAAIAAAMADQS